MKTEMPFLSFLEKLTCKLFAHLQDFAVNVVSWLCEQIAVKNIKIVVGYFRMIIEHTAFSLAAEILNFDNCPVHTVLISR